MPRCSAFALIAVIAAPAAAKPLSVGDPAPGIAIHTFDDTHVDVSALKGQVVIVNRWATWCGPCKKELPELDTYYRAHAGQGLRIFAMTTEDSIPAYKLKPLSAALAFPLAYNFHGAFPDLAGVPTNYVIDRAGVVRYAKAGAFDAETLAQVVTPLLAAPQH